MLVLTLYFIKRIKRIFFFIFCYRYFLITYYNNVYAFQCGRVYMRMHAFVSVCVNNLDFFCYVSFLILLLGRFCPEILTNYIGYRIFFFVYFGRFN